MSFDVHGRLSDEHGYKCPECGGHNIYFSNRAKDKVILTCHDCWKRFGVIDAERKIHRATTNADRIRAMNDNELAEWLHSILDGVNGNPEITPSESFLLDWLQSETKE